MRNFDEDRFDRQFDRTFNFIALFWVIFVLFDLAILVAAVIVAIHFLGKVW